MKLYNQKIFKHVYLQPVIHPLKINIPVFDLKLDFFGVNIESCSAGKLGCQQWQFNVWVQDYFLRKKNYKIFAQKQRPYCGLQHGDSDSHGSTSRIHSLLTCSQKQPGNVEPRLTACVTSLHPFWKTKVTGIRVMTLETSARSVGGSVGWQANTTPFSHCIVAANRLLNNGL